MSEAGKPVLIAGPTASGKSALALRMAERDGGVVINADSMQVYAELPILSARPTRDDEARAPHRLYGHVPAARAYSVGQWLEEARREIAQAHADGRRAIVVGGTGLYFMALTRGLSPIPPIPAEVRETWRARAATTPPAELHAMLAARDPRTAVVLRASDTQRLVRALEVLDATGRPLAAWWQEPGVPVVGAGEFEGIVVEIDRSELYARCEARFDAMMEAGALHEVAALAAQGLDQALPAMRALGVAPLLAHLAGRLPLDDAVMIAKRDTRHYVRRQATWLRRNMMTWNRLIAQ